LSNSTCFRRLSASGGRKIFTGTINYASFSIFFLFFIVLDGLTLCSLYLAIFLYFSLYFLVLELEIHLSRPFALFSLFLTLISFSYVTIQVNDAPASNSPTFSGLYPGKQYFNYFLLRFGFNFHFIGSYKFTVNDSRCTYSDYVTIYDHSRTLLYFHLFSFLF
jgi:hypothetical protein